MIFSYIELKRIIDKEIKIERMIDAINSIGFEVEKIDKFNDLKNVKFGKILKINKNPNADKLNVCEIEFSDKKRIIQTNAENVYEGMIILAFIPGSIVNGIKFDSKKIKGVVSEGMLTSLSELGIDKELIRDSYLDKIQEYNEYTIKDDPIKVLGLNDTLIEVDILSNRADAQSHIIMAKEIAAYFNIEIPKIKVNKPKFESKLKITQMSNNHISVIESKSLPKINKYEIILLHKYGIKSINNVIDFSNLILIMTGQPSHVYKNESKKLIVTNSNSKKGIKVLGDKEVSLNKDDIIVKNEMDILSVAGIIGVNNKGIEGDEKEFLLEFGVFDNKQIRNTARDMKITNLSSNKSSKPIAQGTTKLAIDYASSKLSNFSNTIQFIEKKTSDIKFDIKKFEFISGIKATNNKDFDLVIDKLKKLGFKFNKNSFSIPNYRYDIESQQDLEEEILRFYGYNNLTLNKPKISPYVIKDKCSLKNIISGMQYDEINTYTLISSEKNIFNPFSFKKKVKLNTYVSKEREEIRDSQLVSLYEILEYNEKRNNIDMTIFSIGMLSNEESTICFGTSKTFNELKKDLLTLIPINSKFERFNNDKFHNGVSAKIIHKDKMIGWIGKPNPKILDSNYFMAEILINKINESKIMKFKEYDENPLKFRDITFKLKANEEIHEYIKDIEFEEIKEIDVYEKDDYRNVTLRIYGSDEQVQSIDKKYNDI